MQKPLLSELEALQSRSSLEEEHPCLNITLKPYGSNDYQIKYVEMVYGIQSPELKEKDILVALTLTMASIPCAELSEEGVIARDESGPLSLVEGENDGKYGRERCWRVSRLTKGNVALLYRFYPRVVPKDYRSSPYFDFRNEQYGANGAGCTFLAMPENKTYSINLRWDLSEMPADTRAITLKGEGDLSFAGKPETIQFTYYQVGKIQELKLADSPLSLYWLSDPMFDVAEIGRVLHELYAYMTKFFQDEGTEYKVLFRKDPFKLSGGGTALPGGFMYGYSEAELPTPEKALNTLAHEMVHNWPGMEDLAGEGTWYSEGTAEFYSVALPYRAGITDLDFVGKQITDRAVKYFGNPFITYDNKEAYKLYWKERKAQRLPYGRGFFYLVDTDMKIRRKSKGSRSLDNLVLELVKQSREGKTVKVSDWEELIEQELGKEGLKEFHQMCSGKIIEINSDWFDGAFTIKRGPVYDRDSDSVVEGHIWEKKPDATAEKVQI